MVVTQGKSPIKTVGHCLVIGAGVMGCTLAYELSKFVKVTLIEKMKVGSATVPVALLNPFRGRSARATSLDLAGLSAIQTLADELSGLGLDHGINTTGIIRIASNSKQAKKWRELQGIQWLEQKDFPTVYNAPFGGFLVNSGGLVDSHKFLRTLVTAAKSNNLRLVEDCQVLDIKANNAPDFNLPKYNIDTTKGSFDADAVFLCIGATKPFTDILSKMTYTTGEVVILKSNTEIPYPLAGAVYASKIAEEFYIGGNHRPFGEEDPHAVRQLQHSVGWFIPSLKTAQPLAVWTGNRAKSYDNQPIVKELKPRLWFVGALAGRGFLCAAYIAKKLLKINEEPL